MAQKQNPGHKRRNETRRTRKTKHRHKPHRPPTKITFDPVCGIDIDSERFDMCIVFPNEGYGEIVFERRDWNLEQNDEGFRRCKKRLEEYGVKRVAMEATGVYHEALQYYLLDASFEVITVNALFINPKGRNMPKRDKLDAFNLAEKLFFGIIGKNGKYLPSYIPTDVYELALKLATRHDKRIKDERTRSKNRIHKLFARRALSLSKAAGGSGKKPWHLVADAIANGESCDEFYKRIGSIHHSTRKALENRKDDIEELFASVKEKFDKMDRIMIGMHLETIKRCNETIVDIQSHIDELWEFAPPPLKRLVHLCNQNLPGVSDSLALRIVLEYGDPHRFNNRRQIGSYTGLEPNPRMSGGKGSMRGITKTGNNYLRRHLFMAAENARKCNREFATLYTRLKRKGRKHKQVICAIARKLGVIYVQKAKEDEIYNTLINEAKLVDSSPSEKRNT